MEITRWRSHPLPATTGKARPSPGLGQSPTLRAGSGGYGHGVAGIRAWG